MAHWAYLYPLPSEDDSMVKPSTVRVLFSQAAAFTLFSLLSVCPAVMAQQPTLSLPSCFITGSGGTVANVNLPVGSLCISKGDVKKLFKPCKASDATNVLDFNRCIKKASKKDISTILQITQAGEYKICPSGGASGGCDVVKIDHTERGEHIESVSGSPHPSPTP